MCAPARIVPRLDSHTQRQQPRLTAAQSGLLRAGDRMIGFTLHPPANQSDALCTLS